MQKQLIPYIFNGEKMSFKTKAEDKKSNTKNEEPEKFTTLSIMAKLAAKKGYVDMAKDMESISKELAKSGKLARLEEQVRPDPGLVEFLRDNKNVIYVGPTKPYMDDITDKISFSLIASDKRISNSMEEFCAVISETMDYLLSKDGKAALIKPNVFDSLIAEASNCAEQEILDSMAFGMLNGIVEVKKQKIKKGIIKRNIIKKDPNAVYFRAKLLTENLLQNRFISQKMKYELNKAWDSV